MSERYIDKHVINMSIVYLCKFCDKHARDFYPVFDDTNYGEQPIAYCECGDCGKVQMIKLGSVEHEDLPKV